MGGSVMRAHVIEDGLVANTIEVESLDFMPNLIDASNGGTIGDTWDGTQFIPAPPAAEYLPTQISKKQAKWRLVDMELYDAVNAAIPTMGIKAQIAWNDADVFVRTDPLVLEMVSLFSWTGEEMDSFFVEAAKL